MHTFGDSMHIPTYWLRFSCDKSRTYKEKKITLKECDWPSAIVHNCPPPTLALNRQDPKFRINIFELNWHNSPVSSLRILLLLTLCCIFLTSWSPPAQPKKKYKLQITIYLLHDNTPFFISLTSLTIVYKYWNFQTNFYLILTASNLALSTKLWNFLIQCGLSCLLILF